MGIYHDSTSATTNDSWRTWVTVDSTNTATTDCTWNQWASTTASTSCDNIWYAWTNDSTDSTVTVNTRRRSVRVPFPPPSTQQDIAEVNRRRAEADRKARERAEELRLAEQTALATLKEALTKEQLERFDRDECIPVDTDAGKFVISKGRSANISRLDEKGKVVEKLCCLPYYDEAGKQLPTYDVMLAQLLHLKANTRQFIDTANKTRVG